MLSHTYNKLKNAFNNATSYPSLSCLLSGRICLSTYYFKTDFVLAFPHYISGSFKRSSKPPELRRLSNLMITTNWFSVGFNFGHYRGLDIRTLKIFDRQFSLAPILFTRIYKRSKCLNFKKYLHFFFSYNNLVKCYCKFLWIFHKNVDILYLWSYDEHIFEKNYS